jgi:glutamate--cysteine ligase
MLPFVFEDGFGYERYCDYALDVPMYFVFREGEYVDAAGQSFRDFLEGKLPALPGEKPTIADWTDHLSTAFPEVVSRASSRCAGPDGGRWGRICALPALWVGLLYSGTALDAAWDRVKHWTIAEREELRHSVPKLALEAPVPGGGTVRELSEEVLEIATSGLRERAETQCSRGK